MAHGVPTKEGKTMATTTVPRTEGAETARIVTLTQQHREGQALQQYAYDPAVIDQAVMLGDMSKMPPGMRLDFYKAVCLSVGLNPLTQPFTVLKRQDGTTWLYANSSCTQQLASLYRVSFRDVEREHVTILGDPLYIVRVTAVAPDGRAVPSQAVVSLTKKKREAAGTWPNGDPKFRDVLDADAEPVLVPLRGESLANALMRADTKGFRRATLALVGLGWMQSDFEGRAVAFNLQTGALDEDPRLVPATRHLDAPAEQAKGHAEHSADLYGEQGGDADPLVARINTVLRTHGLGDQEIAAYWEKMAGKYPDLGDPTVLTMLYDKLRSVPETTQREESPERAADQGAVDVEGPRAAEAEPRGAPSEARRPPRARQARTMEAPAEAPPEGETWRTTLRGKASGMLEATEGLKDTALAEKIRSKAQEGFRLAEDPDATVVQGEAVLEALRTLRDALAGQGSLLA
jgi:hypothetical protein